MAAGDAFAATASIMASSFMATAGFSVLSGGNTDVSMTFGAASLNMSQMELGYLGKSGNNALENIGYGLGALANMSDIVNVADQYLQYEEDMRQQYAKGNKYNGAGPLNQKTVGQNILGNSFPGGKNPTGQFLDYQGNPLDYYGAVPNGTFLEYPGYIHDIAYYNLGKGGISGLTTSLKCIPADYRFVAQSFYLGAKHITTSPLMGMKSIAMGLGLGLIAAPKTLAIPLIIYGGYSIITHQ